MTEREPLHSLGQDGQLQTWLERSYSHQEAGEQLTKSLSTEFNLAIQPSRAIEGVLAEYCDEEQGSPFTYRLYVNRETGPLDKNYLSLLTSSGLLLGNLRKVASVPIPFPQESSFKKLNELERDHFYDALMLTQELIQGGPPDQWDPYLHSLLGQQGNRWIDASLIKGKRIVKILHEPPMQIILPELEKRLDAHLEVFSKTGL